jgi:hypothetical protein
MKASVIIALVALIALSSCKKEYICYCKSASGNPIITKSIMTKEHAEAVTECMDVQKDYKDSHPMVEVSCFIK